MQLLFSDSNPVVTKLHGSLKEIRNLKQSVTPSFPMPAGSKKAQKQCSVHAWKRPFPTTPNPTM